MSRQPERQLNPLYLAKNVKGFNRRLQASVTRLAFNEAHPIEALYPLIRKKEYTQAANRLDEYKCVQVTDLQKTWKEADARAKKNRKDGEAAVRQAYPWTIRIVYDPREINFQMPEHIPKVKPEECDRCVARKHCLLLESGAQLSLGLKSATPDNP